MSTKDYQGKKFKITEYLHSNIFIVENVINSETCAKLVSQIKDYKCQKLKFSYGNNVQCFKIENSFYPELVDYFTKTILEIIDEIRLFKNIPFTGMQFIEIRKVYGETREHIDGTGLDTSMHPTRNHLIKLIRSLTIVGVLNDDFEGGEYCFPCQNIKFKLKAGSFVIFPPYWTHPHSVSKIITKPNCNEYRYIVSTWGLDDTFITYEEDKHLNNIIALC